MDCTVQLYPTLQTRHSDSTGRCVFSDIPFGRYFVVARKDGYKATVSESMLIESERVYHVPMFLSEATIQLPTLQVFGQAQLTANEPHNPFAFLSARSFTPEETDRYPVALQDPARAALSFAGVQGGRNDLENPIIVRGNSPFGVSWRIEGVDVPNPNHFAKHGASGGGVSIFSSYVTGKSDFYSGAMPAEFGNALSASFDMKLREGNDQHTNYRFRSSFIGVDVSAEGPIQKSKSSFLLNYRYSTLGMLQWLLFYIADNRKINTFSDFSFHVSSKGKSTRNQTSFWGVSGKSLDRALPLQPPLERTMGEIDDWEDRIRRSATHILGLVHRRHPSHNSNLTYSLAYTQSTIRRTSDTLSMKNERFRYNSERYIDHRLIGQISVIQKIGTRTTFKSGIQWQGMYFDFNKEVLPKKWAFYPDSPKNLGLWWFNGKGVSSLLNAYFTVLYRLSDRLHMQAGGHYMHFFFNQSKSLEPRIALKFTPLPTHIVAISYGQHAQLLPLSTYFVSERTNQENGSMYRYPNQTLPFPKSTHWVLSHRFLLKNQLKLTTEVYYQTQSRVLVQTERENPFWMLNYSDGYPEATNLSATGRGYTQGVDFTIEKIFLKNFYFLATGSIAKARFQDFSGRQFPTQFDDRFSSAFTLGREIPIGENKRWQFGLRGLLNGGVRYSPPNLEKTNQLSLFIPDYDQFNSLWAPNYRRLDGRVSFFLQNKNRTHQWALDVQNVTHHQNISRIQYNPVLQQIQFIRKGSGLTPILSYQISF